MVFNVVLAYFKSGKMVNGVESSSPYEARYDIKSSQRRETLAYKFHQGVSSPLLATPLLPLYAAVPFVAGVPFAGISVGAPLRAGVPFTDEIVAGVPSSWGNL